MERPITCNMRIETVLESWPQTRDVFRAMGFDCVECHQRRFETVGEGARVHGLDLSELLALLNQARLDPVINAWPYADPRRNDWHHAWLSSRSHPPDRSSSATAADARRTTAATHRAEHA